MARRDQTFDDQGTELAFRQWPDDGAGGIDIAGQIVDWDGSTRPLTQDEIDAVSAQADEQDRDTRRQRIAADPVSVLEARAQFYRDAPATTVSNVVTHVTVIRSDLTKLYDLLADIIRSMNLDQ